MSSKCRGHRLQWLALQPLTCCRFSRVFFVSCVDVEAHVPKGNGLVPCRKFCIGFAFVGISHEVPATDEVVSGITVRRIVGKYLLVE